MREADVVVVGSGAAGMAAAITARLGGLSVILLEKMPQVGGTTARSGGWAWVPRNGLPGGERRDASLSAARTYLFAEAGAYADPDRIATYLDEAPRMLDYLSQHSLLRFEVGNNYPDYHPDRAGGAATGRSLFSPPFDGRQLGDHLASLARPFPESLFMGIGLNSGPELRHFFQATRSWRSAAYVARRILGHWAQVIVYGRGVRLVNGNALAARLYKSALDLGVEIQTNAPVLKLVRDNDRVSEVHFGSRDAETRLRALRGVVLATGGWSGSTEQQRVHFPHVATGSAHYSLVPPGNCGDGLKLAVALGGAMNTKSENAAAWAPVSRPPRADGSQGIFFHLVDRAKPGVIMVGADGQRFCNESDCYHDVVQAMLLHAQACGKEGAFLLCDHLTLRRYGLGAVRPAPLPFQKHLRSGYLIRGGNWAELACHLDLPADVLEATVAKYNSDVDAGTDQSFGRGRTAYNRLLGDPGSKQNPCMGHLAQGPFYAVRLWPGDLGAYVGLETDMHGRVLDEQRNIIKGLYAAGSDVTTFAGGSYPGAGAMIGPALTFGYLCGRDLAKHPSSSVSAPS